MNCVYPFYMDKLRRGRKQAVHMQWIVFIFKIDNLRAKRGKLCIPAHTHGYWSIYLYIICERSESSMEEVDWKLSIAVHARIWLYVGIYIYNINKCKVLIGKEGVCESSGWGRNQKIYIFNLIIILSDALLDKTWTHCPRHSIAEGQIQYSSVNIDTMTTLQWLDYDMGKVAMKCVYISLNNLMPCK